MKLDPIRDAWSAMSSCMGKHTHHRRADLRRYAKMYAIAVLEAHDEDRIQVMGKRHLEKAAIDQLKGKSFDSYVSHVIVYERNIVLQGDFDSF